MTYNILCDMFLIKITPSKKVAMVSNIFCFLNIEPAYQSKGNRKRENGFIWSVNCYILQNEPYSTFEKTSILQIAKISKLSVVKRGENGTG